MIKMRDLNTGFSYRSSWTGYAKGRGLNIVDAPVIHSARINSRQLYDDPFKGPRHSFSKKYEQFIEALKSSEYAIVRHGGKDENQELFGTGELIAVYEIHSYAIDETGGVKFQLGKGVAFQSKGYDHTPDAIGELEVLEFARLSSLQTALLASSYRHQPGFAISTIYHKPSPSRPLCTTR